jgi:predicted phage terminase large subunit-like protein
MFHRCATDRELFALVYFPHYARHPFNSYHRERFKNIRLGERKIRRVRAAPRGYAKSTLSALIDPIHDLCYGTENYILIFSNTEAQSVAKLKDIRTELLTNDRLIADYGIRFPRKNVAETAFEVFAGEHGCMFQAFGSGTEVRGARYGEHRPSKIILDDVEHSEEVYNEAIREKYSNWFKEVITRLGDENTNIEFVGTVLARKALLVDLIKNPVYDARVYKAVIAWSQRQDLWNEWRKLVNNLDDENRMQTALGYFEANRDAMLEGTEVLWEAKEPYYALQLEIIETGMRSFMKEKQNDPQGDEEKIFTTFHWYTDVTLKDGQRGALIESNDVFIPYKIMRPYGVIDPATGQTKPRMNKKGDFSCLLAGYQEPKGRLLVHHDWTKRVAPSEYIQQILTMHLEYEFEKFAVETNLYRNLLLPNIAEARRSWEDKHKKIMRLPLYDIEQVENKHKRIYTLEPKLTNGWILLNRNLSEEFKSQLEEFPKADHDDCPDALEMLWGVVQNRYAMKPVNLDALGGR